MKIEELPLKGSFRIEPKIFEDSRGYFFESYNYKTLKKAIGDFDFIQDNQTKSVKNTIRGIHFQKKFPQAKLVRVLSGEVLDLIIDLRKNSETFGQVHSEVLSDENKVQIYIPKGFGHGFSVLSETAVFFYKVNDYYYADDEGGIRWDDPDLNIDWKVNAPIISEKDTNLPTWSSIRDFF